jgi:hypothetical protein
MRSKWHYCKTINLVEYERSPDCSGIDDCERRNWFTNENINISNVILKYTQRRDLPENITLPLHYIFDGSPTAAVPLA